MIDPPLPLPLPPSRGRARLRTRLVIALAVVLGAISLFICLFFPHWLETVIEQGARTEAEHLASMAAFNVAPSLLFGDRTSGQEALAGASAASRLAYIVVLDAGGAVFAARHLDVARRAGFRDADRIYRISVPVRHHDRVIGSLHLGLSLLAMDRQIARMRGIIAAVSGVVFLAALLVAIGISSHLTRPLGEVVAAARAIAQGDWRRRAPVHGGGESRELAQVFNVMVDRLEDARRALEVANASLAARGADLESEVAHRRDGEEALRRSIERFELAAAAVDGVIYDFDTASDTLSWTEGLARVLGYRSDEAGPTRAWWYGLLHPEDRQRAQRQLRQALAEGRDFVAEYRLRSRDHGYLDVRDRGRVLLDAGGRVARMVGIIENVTEVKRLEEQFIQAQKMEGIGRVAGGVAHDFNNLLTSILGYSELVLGELPPTAGSTRAQVEEIHKAGLRAAGLTKQLLAFSRKQAVAPRQLDLNAVVGDIEKMLTRLIGEDVDLVVTLDSAAGQVLADPTQLEQVILNVAVNARDAMPDGGRLEIQSELLTLAAADERHAVPAGRYACLRFRDSGCGMDEATRARIFEPFFTTKPRGQGTGLGMAMVYGIVKRAEGHLWVDSAPGYGTTVTVLLPSHDPVAAPEEEVETVAARGRETVLLVEDDEAVRTLVHGWLTAHGYSVLEAEHPEVALGIAARNTAPIDLLLTDVVMPGMNGRRLADRILEMRPLIRVVYMSGYLDDVVLRSGVDGSGGPLLEKPFTAPELLRTLRAALAMPTEPAGAAAGRGW